MSLCPSVGFHFVYFCVMWGCYIGVSVMLGWFWMGWFGGVAIGWEAGGVIVRDSDSRERDSDSIDVDG